MKKDVVLDEVKNEFKEKNVDEIVLKCYYNICRYYNKDYTIVEKHRRKIRFIGLK